MVDALTRTNLLGAPGNAFLSTSASVAPILPLLANLPALAVPVLALRASSSKSKAAKLERARSKTVLRAPARVALHGPHLSDRPRTSLIVETLGGAPDHLRAALHRAVFLASADSSLLLPRLPHSVTTILVVKTSHLRSLGDDHQRVALRLSLLAGAHLDLVSGLLLPPSSLAARPALLPRGSIPAQASRATSSISREAAAVVATVRTPRVAFSSRKTRHSVVATTITRLWQVLWKSQD